jgi:hypothetical protein
LVAETQKYNPDGCDLLDRTSKLLYNPNPIILPECSGFRPLSEPIDPVTTDECMVDSKIVDQLCRPKGPTIFAVSGIVSVISCEIIANKVVFLLRTPDDTNRISWEISG